MIVGVIGLGLIGGSAVISLKQRGFASEVIGFDANSNHCIEAKKLGFIDQSVDFDTLCKKADLILIAIPVDAARKVVREVLNLIDAHQVVMDMGSTKGGVCAAVKDHPNRKSFVATHPIAGTENAGPSAAFDGLYDGKITIICEQELSDSKALALVQKVYEALKMNILYMDAEEHDKHIAYVSHLSHISSFVLGQTVLEIEKDEKSIFNMAGSGFASTVRLAKSSPNMWAPIFEQNKTHLSTALGAYIENLQAFKSMIDNQDTSKLHDLMSEVNQIRRVLDGIKLNEK